MEVKKTSGAVALLELKEDKPVNNGKKDVQTNEQTIGNDSVQIKTSTGHVPPEKSGKPQPEVFKRPKTIFKSDAEKNAAEKYLDRFSNNAFDPNRSVEDRFLNLKPISKQAFKGNIQTFGADPQAGSMNLADLKDVKNFEQFVSASEKSLSKDKKVIAELGPNPTKEQIDQYIKKNLNSIAQNLGDDMPYVGYLSFVGDANAMETLAKGEGVCTDIHAAVTAFRKSFGQEAYLVMTSGSDAAHVFTIFKENGKWNIQNYGNVYSTDAKTISELYDQAMPEQRKIKIYDVAADGNVKQVTTDHLTATGLAERRFRAESGAGSYNPWVSEDGITIGNNEIGLAKNGFYIGINPSDRSIKTAYYKKTENGDTQKIQGFAIEGQSYLNKYGFSEQHIDAKYESEKKYDNGEKQVYGREHFSVFTGAEKMPDSLYWDNLETGPSGIEKKDPAMRLGVSYARNDSKLFGDGPLKFELGDQTKVSGTITFPPNDPIGSNDYVGRIYGDAVAEGKLVTGAFYQPTRDLTIRTGLASGVDLAKIDGVKSVKEQLLNIAESDAYADIRYSKGMVAVNALGIVPLHNPSQWKAGAGVAIAPNDKFAIGVTYIHEKIVKDNIDSLRAGIEITPVNNLAIGASITTPVIGDTAKNIEASGYLKIKF